MKCREVSELISEYLDGELNGAREHEFESHIELCQACASEVDSTRKMLSSLSTLSNQRCPVDCWEHVRTEVATRRLGTNHWWRWVLRPVVAAPALAAMASITLFLVWPWSSSPMASDKRFAPEYTYYIGAHSHLQRQEAFADPDVVFVGAELQKASLVSDDGQ